MKIDVKGITRKLFSKDIGNLVTLELIRLGIEALKKGARTRKRGAANVIYLSPPLS